MSSLDARQGDEEDDNEQHRRMSLDERLDALERTKQSTNKAKPTEASPLLEGAAQPSSRGKVSFIFFSILFSLNYASLTSTMNIAASLVGEEAAGLGNGVMFFLLSATALTAAVPLLGCMTVRLLLTASLLVSCIYIVMFIIIAAGTDEYPSSDAQAPALVGGVLGGLSGGTLWTAQGAYYAGASALVAQQLGISQPKATSELAWIFSFSYLTAEFVAKLSQSIILIAAGSAGEKTAFLILLPTFLATAVIATALFPVLVDDVRKATPAAKTSSSSSNSGDPPSLRDSISKMGDSVIAAAKLWCQEPLRVILIVPYNIGFGAMTPFQVGVVNPALCDPIFGVEAIGFLTSATVVVGMGTTYLLKLVPNRKGEMLSLASAALLVEIACGAVLFGFEDLDSAKADRPGLIYFLLITCYLLHGIGRAAYEGINKALTADLFPSHSSAAFANVVLLTAVSNGICFTIFPRINRFVMIACCTVPVALAIPAGLVVQGILRAEAAPADEGSQPKSDPSTVDPDADYNEEYKLRPRPSLTPRRHPALG